MNQSLQTIAVTKNNFDRLHETATRYKKAAKILVIISYIILLSGVTGVFSVLSVPFGFFFAGAPFVFAFILYIVLQIPILILTTKANNIFSRTSPTYELERKKEHARNMLRYKILLGFVAVIVVIVVFVIIY